jgi:hypothetical protein
MACPTSQDTQKDVYIYTTESNIGTAHNALMDLEYSTPHSSGKTNITTNQT